MPWRLDVQGGQNSVEKQGKKGFPRLRIKVDEAGYSSFLWFKVEMTSPVKCSGSFTPSPEEGSFMLSLKKETGHAQLTISSGVSQPT